MTFPKEALFFFINYFPAARQDSSQSETELRQVASNEQRRPPNRAPEKLLGRRVPKVSRESECPRTAGRSYSEVWSGKGRHGRLAVCCWEEAGEIFLKGLLHICWWNSRIAWEDYCEYFSTISYKQIMFIVTFFWLCLEQLAEVIDKFP